MLLLLFDECAGRRSYFKLLVVMEESFKKWAGHAGMLSGYEATCDGNETMRLLWNCLCLLYELLLHVCYAGQHRSTVI